MRYYKITKQQNERSNVYGTEEKRYDRGMVEKLRQMDNSSLVIMKASVDVLAAKERLDKEEAKTA